MYSENASFDSLFAIFYELFQVNHFQNFKFQWTVQDSQSARNNLKFITQLFFRAKNNLIGKYETSNKEEREYIFVLQQTFFISYEGSTYREQILNQIVQIKNKGYKLSMLKLFLIAEFYRIQYHHDYGNRRRSMREFIMKMKFILSEGKNPIC